MIPLMKNAFLNEHETKKALSEFILKTSQFSMGPECIKFEKSFSDFQGRKDSVLFNSGGSANLALLQALKNLGRLKDGDLVAFSALTWSTNVMPIIQMGLVPIPVDCEVNNLNVSSNKLRKSIEKHDIKAFFITNVLGFVADIDIIKNICSEKNIILIEDNCESLGTSLKSGTKAGNFGVGASFSFFIAHHMSTIEGGMIATDDLDLSRMLRIVRANGWDRNLNSKDQFYLRKKYKVKSDFEAKYTFYDLGYNLRPTEITGFLGSFQLKFLKNNILKREENYKKIEKIIFKNDDLLNLEYDHIKTLSTFAIPIICKDKFKRDEYVSRFSGAGIEIRPMIAGNIIRQPFYEKYCETDFVLENTDFIHDCGFYCGNYPELSDSDLEVISSCLYKY